MPRPALSRYEGLVPPGPGGREVGRERGRGSVSPPDGEVRGGMGLSAALPPGKALPGAGSPRPAGEMRWRVVGVRCHPRPAARCPPLCSGAGRAVRQRDPPPVSVGTSAGGGWPRGVALRGAYGPWWATGLAVGLAAEFH